MEGEKGKKRWLTLLGSYKYVLIVVAAGLICMAWPERSQEAKPAADVASSVDLEEMRQEMEEILGEIRGAGELRLMLTLDAGPERLLAGNSSLSYKGAPLEPEDYSRTTETVLISRGSGQDEVVVTREIQPQFRGALVVCQGAADPTVRLAIVEAVSALTGLGSDRISVVQSQM